MSDIDDFVDVVKKWETEFSNSISDCKEHSISLLEDIIVDINSNDTHPCEHNCWHDGVNAATGAVRGAIGDIEQLRVYVGEFQSMVSTITQEVVNS
ncbi:hypothetical protein FACS1894125_2350 [Actinomycetota bacterium]|nr:hypothetical protein FACS1894125_2350 [Actinomycetota bacterium]